MTAKVAVPTCKKCKWYRKLPPHYTGEWERGSCHRFPPMPGEGFPCVYHNYFCGEFTGKAKK